MDQLNPFLSFFSYLHQNFNTFSFTIFVWTRLIQLFCFSFCGTLIFFSSFLSSFSNKHVFGLLFCLLLILTSHLLLCYPYVSCINDNLPLNKMAYINRQTCVFHKSCKKFKSTNRANTGHWNDCIYGFTSRLRIFHLYGRRHHCRWRAAKFRPMLGAQGLWAGRDLYRATFAVTRGLGVSGLIRRTASFSRLLRHTRGCGGSILTRILTGPHSVTSYDTRGGVEIYSNPDPHGFWTTRDRIRYLGGVIIPCWLVTPCILQI
jgi:hypothetical protein